MKFLLCLAALAASPLVFGQQAKPASAATKAAFDKAKIEAYVKSMEGWQDNPQLKINVSDPKPSKYLEGFDEFNVVLVYQGEEVIQRNYLWRNGKIVQGMVSDISQHPFQTNIDKLKSEMSPSFGTPGAKAILTVFSDFQCPYCKEEAKILRTNLLQDYGKDVRVYFKDYPITQIHPWSMPAAIAGRCVFRAEPAKFWDYHDWVFENQQNMSVDNLKSQVIDWAGKNGLDTLQLTRCIDTKATEAEVRKTMAEGRALGIDKTPTLFINGRKLDPQPWQGLEAALRFELDYQKTANNAGEKCCEVTIPGVLKK
jgi:protein-disulfide isomerase